MQQAKNLLIFFIFSEQIKIFRRDSLDKKQIKEKKKWYKKNKPHLYKKVKKKIRIERFKRHKFPGFIELLKWLVIDIIRGKWVHAPLWGIYQFVALPGEGKTLSMVMHIERERKKHKDVRVYTNFCYAHENGVISHWSDIIRYAKECKTLGVACIIAMDEIHVTFDSTEWKSFPAEMLALLSFNRKFRTQFLCTSQIYERIPKKVRDIANYTVLCKNVMRLDRLFRNYYFNTNDYEKQFEGKKAKAEMIRSFVASDYDYALYDTLKQVDRMVLDAKQEKTKKQQAFDTLFGSMKEETTEALKSA